jgi:hypothetical protein
VNDLTTQLDANTCPRCLGGIPNDAQRGAYIGALSRTDNKTYICSSCGTDEAMENFTVGAPLPQTEWPFTY